MHMFTYIHIYMWIYMYIYIHNIYIYIYIYIYVCLNFVQSYLKSYTTFTNLLNLFLYINLQHLNKVL